MKCTRRDSSVPDHSLTILANNWTARIHQSCGALIRSQQTKFFLSLADATWTSAKDRQMARMSFGCMTERLKFWLCSGEMMLERVD